ncbi:MAG TPA: hypothetical protein VIT92_11475, partial [Burkholderiaceae bacterium]
GAEPMKSHFTYAAGLALLILAGCKATPLPPEPPPPPPPTTIVELIPFQVGISSKTVEDLAKQQQCTSSQGAGLVTDKAPLEIYRIKCDDGRIFMARCELRQCTPMQ